MCERPLIRLLLRFTRGNAALARADGGLKLCVCCRLLRVLATEQSIRLELILVGFLDVCFLQRKIL